MLLPPPSYTVTSFPLKFTLSIFLSGQDQIPNVKKKKRSTPRMPAPCLRTLALLYNVQALPAILHAFLRGTANRVIDREWDPERAQPARRRFTRAITETPHVLGESVSGASARARSTSHPRCSPPKRKITHSAELRAHVSSSVVSTRYDARHTR